MLRLRHELTLAPGMSVADVGAGRGEMTVALAAEIGPSGRVYATDIDPEALEQIRTRVAAAELRNVTILQPAPGRGIVPDMKSYGQFCSLARALDLLGERPLVHAPDDFSTGT